MPDKLGGFDLYRALGSPVKVVAPMVDASELAWRMLARKYGAELCFTPMLHSGTYLHYYPELPHQAFWSYRSLHP